MNTNSRSRKNRLVAASTALLAAALLTITSCKSSPSASPPEPSSVAGPAITQSLQDQVTAWFSDGGRDRLLKISGDLGDIGNDTETLDAGSMIVHCTSLSSDVKEAKNYGPFPDKVIQLNWSRALDDYESAATHCIVGASAMDSSQMTFAADKLDSASEELALATKRINAISAGL